MSVNKNSRIFITGHKGLVGSSIYKKFKNLNYRNIVIKTRKQLDLTNQKKVENFFKKNILIFFLHFPKYYKFLFWKMKNFNILENLEKY